MTLRTKHSLTCDWRAVFCALPGRVFLCCCGDHLTASGALPCRTKNEIILQDTDEAGHECLTRGVGSPVTSAAPAGGDHRDDATAQRPRQQSVCSNFRYMEQRSER